MLSPEFKETIAKKNLLRARIMMKDSFLVDPTATQFDEMLSYAKEHIPEILVPFDDETLENNETKWNESIMNDELIDLPNNFSKVRIDHLKKVVAKVLETKATEIRRKRNDQTKQQERTSKEKFKKVVEVSRDLITAGAEITAVAADTVADYSRREKSTARHNAKKSFTITFDGDWDPVLKREFKDILNAILNILQNHNNNNK